MSTHTVAGPFDLDDSGAEIAQLESRIAKAASDSDAWRASGQQERYLASFLLMEALEVQLSAMHGRVAARIARTGDPR